MRPSRVFRNALGNVGHNLAHVSLDGVSMVQVTLFYEGDDPTKGGTRRAEHIIGIDDLQKFLQASLELHFEPGCNPHNGREATPVQAIALKLLVRSGPYWWATPGLQNNGDPHGAITYDWSCYYPVWLRPDGVRPRELRSATPSYC